MLSSVGLKNKSLIFLSGGGGEGGEGGGRGPPLKKFENQESRSHLWSFCKDNLPSVNEQYQRILLPFIACSFLNIKFRQICILSVFFLGCR